MGNAQAGEVLKLLFLRLLPISQLLSIKEIHKQRQPVLGKNPVIGGQPAARVPNPDDLHPEICDREILRKHLAPVRRSPENLAAKTHLKKS